MSRIQTVLCQDRQTQFAKSRKIIFERINRQFCEAHHFAQSEYMQFQSKYARSVLHGGVRLNTCIKYLTIDNQACKALGKSAQLDPVISCTVLVAFID